MDFEEAASSTPKFKEGDIVQLISGGPKMTVSYLRQTPSKKFTGCYDCKWFAGNKLETAPFRETSLIPWIEPKK